MPAGAGEMVTTTLIHALIKKALDNIHLFHLRNW